MKQKNSKIVPLLIILVFLGFTGWWLYITLALRHVDHYSNIHNQAFASTYGVMSLLGGLVGIVASLRWGGHRSLIGRSLLFFSAGLIAQEFGQIAYSYYQYAAHVQIPYPSWGDLGYFSSVLFYIYASYLLLKATGAKLLLKDNSKRVVAIILPLILLGASYIYFLRDYKFDFSSAQSTVAVLLDFGYPLGQATYISLALLTFLLSKKLLGGIMKKKILAILLALVVQYIADFTFLEAAKTQKVFPGGANDYLYLLAYTAMALALNSFRLLPALTAPSTKDKSGSTE